MAKSKGKSGGTRWGHHAYATFRDCPRKYFLTYVFQGGWENKTGSLTASLGTLWHEWRASFLKTGLAAKAARAVRRRLEEERARWKVLQDTEAQAEVKADLERLAVGYPKFHEEWQKQNGKLEYESFETEGYAPISVNSLEIPYTVRKDAIVRWKSERFIEDAKCSGLSWDRMLDYHRLGGQVSGYVHSEPECLGGLIEHVRPLKTPQYYRKPVLRTPLQVEEWKKSIAKTYSRIAGSNPNDPADWEPHFDQCVTYTWTCPFQDACLTLRWDRIVQTLEAIYRRKEEV